MEQNLDQTYQILQKLTGLHRQLLDCVRIEKRALVEADLKALEETVYAKQALLEAIRQAEIERQTATVALAAAMKKPLKVLALNDIIIAVQGWNPKLAERFRGALNAMTILVQHVREQNEENGKLLERSLEHIQAMKRNVLGERTPRSGTYTQRGQNSPPGGARLGASLISKEA